MANVSQAMQAKSDQLNAVDIMGSEPVITVRDVQVRGGVQPVWVFFHGDNNRPWKPSKGMIRILAAGWSNESDNWIGKSVQIYMEQSVKYAGQEVGGIRIRAMSDIPQKGIIATIALNKQKREPCKISHLSMERPKYSEAAFEKGFEAMVQAMHDGKMTLSQVIARCQKTGDLSQEQMQRLADNAPVEIDDLDDNIQQPSNNNQPDPQPEPTPTAKKEIDGENF